MREVQLHGHHLERNLGHNLRHSLVLTSLYCLVVTVIFQIVYSHGHPRIDFLPSLLSSLAISFGYGYSAVICTHLLKRYIPAFSTRQNSFIALGFGVIIGSINAVFWMKDKDALSLGSNVQLTFLLGFIFSGICFIFFHTYELKIKAQQELEIARRKQSEQEKALVLSQLKQLQSQIEPHFLFNTLANLNALIDKDPTMAKTLLGKLTDLLRATLKRSRNDWVSLEEELSLIDAYLAIQKIRLEPRLSYVITNNLTTDDVSAEYVVDKAITNEAISSDAKMTADFNEKTFLVPPMLIQPLVENAIQHGIELLSRPGHLCVNITRGAAHLHIQVIDDGKGFETQGASAGDGIGLENIRQRLATLYGANANLSIRERETGGAIAEIRLPFSVSSPKDTYGE